MNRCAWYVVGPLLVVIGAVAVVADFIYEMDKRWLMNHGVRNRRE